MIGRWTLLGMWTRIVFSFLVPLAWCTFYSSLTKTGMEVGPAWPRVAYKVCWQHWHRIGLVKIQSFHHQHWLLALWKMVPWKELHCNLGACIQMEFTDCLLESTETLQDRLTEVENRQKWWQQKKHKTWMKFEFMRLHNLELLRWYVRYALLCRLDFILVN